MTDTQRFEQILDNVVHVGATRMNFQFSTHPHHFGHIACPLTILHTMLRLPKDVVIRAVHQHPDRADACIIELEGNLPADGELNVQYGYEHHTIVTFKEFTSTNDPQA